MGSDDDFPIRKVVQKWLVHGLLTLRLAVGLVGCHFSWQKKGTLLAMIYLCIFHLFPCVQGSRNGWMSVDDVLILVISYRSLNSWCLRFAIT